MILCLSVELPLPSANMAVFRKRARNTYHMALGLERLPILKSAISNLWAKISAMWGYWGKLLVKTGFIYYTDYF